MQQVILSTSNQTLILNYKNLSLSMDLFTSKLKNSTQVENLLLLNCQQRSKTINKIRKLLQNQKNTILLLTIDSTIGNLLIPIAKWILGATLTRKKKLKYQITNQDQITHKSIYLFPSMNINLELLQNQHCRVLALNMNPIQKITTQTIKDLSQIIFALNIIQQKIGQKNIVYYYAINGIVVQEEINEAIQKHKKFFYNEQVRLILCDFQLDQQQQTQQYNPNKIIINSQDKYPKFPFSIDTIFQNNQQLPFISTFITNTLNDQDPTLSRSQSSTKKSQKQTTRKKLLQERLRQILKQITYSLRQFLKFVPQIIQNTLIQKQYLNYQLFNPILKNIKLLFDEMEFQQQYQQKNYYNKNDDELAYKHFILRAIQLKSQYQIFDQQQKSINKLKQLLNKILEQLSLIPKFTSSDVNSLKIYSTLLIQQNQLINNLSPKCIPMYTSILHALTSKPQSKSKLAQIISRIKLEPSKPCAYYDLFQSITTRTSSSLKQGQQKDCDIIATKYKNFDKQLPIYRYLFILKSQSQNPIKICQTISNIFTIYIQNNQHYNFTFLHQLFVQIGKNLEKFGFTKHALEIYKKLKFDQKIKLCVNELIRKNRKQKCKIYQQISDYYNQMGFSAKAYQYAQLLYQSISQPKQIDLTFKKMLQLKKKLFTNENSQLAIIESLLTKKNNNSYQYIPYQFKPWFNKDIVDIAHLLPQIKQPANLQASELTEDSY